MFWIALFLILWFLSDKVPNFFQYFILGPILGLVPGGLAFSIASIANHEFFTFPGFVCFTGGATIVIDLIMFCGEKYGEK
jgi:hypothetical protein